MANRRLMTGLSAIALLGAGLAAAPAALASTNGHHTPSIAHVTRACATSVPLGFATCFAEGFHASSTMHPFDGPPSTALTPAKLQDAYNLTGLESGGATVAIVDAFGYPNLERDLGIFRSYFNLPACTTSNGCLTIMNQTGGSQLPAFNEGWAIEQALDVDAISSACPDCKILMVQSDTNSGGNLGKAAAEAASQPGVVAISNSYGGHDAKDANWAKYYDWPNIAVTASTGDSGWQGGSYPAASQFVTAVGGTTLYASARDGHSDRGWTETAWAGAGSGCSRFNVKVEAQQSFHTGCFGLRAESDVSAAADPNRGGLAWYGPSSETISGWGQYGGTSEASPIIASVYALSGDTKGQANEIPYAHASDLYDITSGSNGSGCPQVQICTARVGWDGPTGLGTPNGVAGF